jgi:hypothetical protein
MFLSPSLVFAVDEVRFEPQSTTTNNIGGCTGEAANSPLCKDIAKEGNPLFGPDGVLTKVANIFALLTGIVSVFMIIISGQRYISSGGDPTKTKSAKDGIMYSAIGIAVAAVAKAIVMFVLSRV